MTTDSLVESKRQKVAADYQARGFDVFLEPESEQFGLPPNLGLDLVAVRGDERVVIEVKTPTTLSLEPDVIRRAEVLKEHPGWRYEVVVVNPLLDGAVEAVGEVVRADLINRRADEVPRLLIQEHEEAALLIAWSALEGALRSREVRRGTSSLTKRLNIKDLYSTGLLTQGQFRLLEEAARLRGRIAHGYLVDSPNVGEIAERVAVLARKAADPEYPTVEEMIDWFFERYEDPAHRVPYDSSEGGYQYVGGGPYDAREELTEAFPNVDTEDLDGAVEQIEAEGFEWVRKDDD